ncbi:acyltransferase family protein [Chryseobacterium soldanellicola]|uniref:acyltransferase family protein n=1 Tax=Chryseobacterium soldanellicola TaxID=311333 RepID=UPI00147FE99C|nr:acyltransferase [Chryseobacterium soldanellicola]
MDTLRALAAVIVLVDHVEIIKKENNIRNYIDNPSLIYPDGHLSVILFFVISGFLITYLLLIEKEKNGRINLKNFYWRRILRIWPLYYLVLFLSYFIFNPDYSFGRILLSVLIFPNVAFAIRETWDVSPQIWSIGVEEQFYIVWPLLFIFISKKKKALFYIAGLIIILTLLPFGLKFINLVFFKSEEFYTIISRFFYGTKFNCLGIGALLGFIFFKNKDGISKILLTYNFLTIIFTLLPFVLWFFKFKTEHLNDELYAVLFAFSIYNIVRHPKINIDNAVTRFLGKISYGIYLYHWTIIILVVKYMPKYDAFYLYNLLLYASVLGLTIFISWLSFVTYERFFLNIKKKYEFLNKQQKSD